MLTIFLGVNVVMSTILKESRVLLCTLLGVQEYIKFQCQYCHFILDLNIRGSRVVVLLSTLLEVQDQPYNSFGTVVKASTLVYGDWFENESRS